jgi:hypothetical protein
MNRRRLEIETLRDAMLVAAGRLDSGGGLFDLTAQPSIPRRSVYGFIERGRVPALLSASISRSRSARAHAFVTTALQQALFFLNSLFIAEQARHPERTEWADGGCRHENSPALPGPVRAGSGTVGAGRG